MVGVKQRSMMFSVLRKVVAMVISKEDVDNLHMEIMSEASFFDSVEIVLDEKACDENESVMSTAE